MKKLLLILVCTSISYYVSAQETVKQQEVGLIFNRLDNFGITYRTGTEKSMWRFNTLFVSGGSNNRESIADSTAIFQSNTGFGLQIGKEFRKDIGNNLELRYGVDLSFNYNRSTYDFDDKSINNNDIFSENITYQPGFNLVFGLNYKFNDHLILGAEVLPSIRYITGTERINNNPDEEDEVRDISGFSYGLSNSSALLSLLYKF